MQLKMLQSQSRVVFTIVVLPWPANAAEARRSFQAAYGSVG